jgi:hypothetical protein
MQACDERQCYAPMEARARLEVRIADQGSAEQNAEVFDPLRAQAAAP